MQDNIIINNQLINYYVSGKNGSHSLLFLHGWRSSGLIWKDIVSKLSINNFNIYSLDLPGFGNSSLPKKAFTVQDYANVVAGFIEKLELKNLILIGHSFGGRIALKLSCDKPSLIKKMVLVNSAGLIFQKKRKWYRALVKVAKPFFKLKFMRKPRELVYKKIGAEDYIATPQLKETFLNVIKEDLKKCLPLIKQQTLIIWGRNDKETPVSFAEVMNKKIKNSKLIVLNDAGHFSFIDKQDEFYNELVKFIG